MTLLKRIQKSFIIICCFIIAILGNHTTVYAKEIDLDEVNIQNYNYTISITLPKPDLFLLFPLNKLARTKIHVVFPLNWAGTEIYVDSIEPKADAFEFGSGWAQNQSLVFLLPADSEQRVNITGDISITALNLDQLTPIQDAYKSVTMDTFKKYTLYVQPTWLIESNNPKIIDTAKKIRGDKNRLEDIVNATYDFVVNRIDYDTLTIDLREKGVYEKPQSAVDTLEKGSGVCIDYSRLLIALLRAQGIPARMVVGAVNTPVWDGPQMPLHAWVQFFTGDAFIDIDPTWGESGKKYISDIDTDHIRLQFSTPGDPENIEGSNGFQAFTLDNHIPFLRKRNPFFTIANFTPIGEIEGTEEAESIHALAPVFYSKDNGYMNPFPNTLKYVVVSFITNPTNLFLFQTLFFSILIIVLFLKYFRRKNKRKGKNQ